MRFLKPCFLVPAATGILSSAILLYSGGAAAEVSQLLSPGVSPKSSDWVSVSQSTTSISTSDLSAEMLSDPKSLLAFLKSRPDALNVDRMTPQIALEVTQTLLFGGEILQAATLITDAKERWPQDERVLQGWSRTLIRVGAPSYVRAAIESWSKKQSGHLGESYTQYLYALSLYLEAPNDQGQLQRVAQILNSILQRDPSYQGPDGVGAVQLSRFLQEITERMSR